MVFGDTAGVLARVPIFCKGLGFRFRDLGVRRVWGFGFFQGP